MNEIMILIVAFAMCYAIWDIFIYSKTKTSIHITKGEKFKFNPNDYRYRIKEEKYESGISKFFPQIEDCTTWRTLSLKIIGLNTNGKDWCDTIEDSQKVLDKFILFETLRYEEEKENKIVKEDKIVEETNHKYQIKTKMKDKITEHIEDLPREVNKIDIDSLIDNLTNLKKKYEKKGYRNVEVWIREDLGILDMSLFGDRDLTDNEKYEDERIAVIFRTKTKTSKGETRYDLLK